MGDENRIPTLGDTPNQATRAIGIPLSSPIHLHMGGSCYPIPCSILSTGKDHKTPQRYPNVPTTSWRISIRSMDSFQGLTLKSPSSWHRSLASNLNFLRLSPFILSPSPQPQALDTTFEARVRDYMAAHTERMENFENTIFKQRKEINAKGEEEGSNKTKVTPDNTEKLTKTEIEMPIMEVEKMNKVENGARNKSIKTSENEEAPGSQPVAYYQKHKINEKLIKGLDNNNRFNNSRSRTQARKKKGKEYKILPEGPAYDAILKKKITKKEDIGGNFEIPCSIGNLKHVNALVDQGSDVNVMPYSAYMKLTDERPAETDIRLSLASHSYIYPLRIAEDVLVEVAEHVYPVDFVILDIRENKNRPFILGTPFLTIAKALIKFETCTITLRSGKSKVSFHRILDSSNVTDKGVKNDIEPIAPTINVNRLVLEWEEKIKLHLEREMKFNQWRSKNFKGKRPTLVATKEGMDDEGEVT
ncbi:MAK10-like protein [Tanacetum coccineum]